MIRSCRMLTLFATATFVEAASVATGSGLVADQSTPKVDSMERQMMHNKPETAKMEWSTATREGNDLSAEGLLDEAAELEWLASNDVAEMYRARLKELTSLHEENVKLAQREAEVEKK